MSRIAHWGDAPRGFDAAIKGVLDRRLEIAVLPYYRIPVRSLGLTLGEPHVVLS
jgi:hypothetical protein